MGSWYDNVLIHWEKTDHFVPAEMRMFFKLGANPQIYAVIHSCHNKHTKHSVLTHIWVKEYTNDTKATVKATVPYDPCDDCSNKTPLYRVVPCEAIQSHCLLMPMKENSQQVLQIHCPTTWADKFFPLDVI